MSTTFEYTSPKTSRVGLLGRELGQRSADGILVAACLVLGAWYGVLGYHEDPASRIRGSDSIGYYIYLPSILLQGDIDFANDFRHLAGEDVFLFPTPDGRAGNPYSIGPAIFWSPFFLLGHLSAITSGYASNGYSAPYFFLVYWGNVLYIIAGLLITFRLIRSFDTPSDVALLATLSILLATQLTYYIFPKSATSHGLSFTLVATFALALRREGLTWRSGLLGGLSALIRWQNLLFVPVLAAAVHVSRSGHRFSGSDARRYVPFVLSVLGGLLPQLILWQALYWRPFLIPQLDGYVDLTRLPVIQVLLSAQHGLITWHPWWLLAGIGLWFLSGKQKAWAIAIGVVFLLQLYLNGTVRDWWGTWSFGHRRFVNLIPLFGVGAGILISRIPQRQARWLLFAGVVLALWNQAFINQYQRALIPRSKPPTFQEFVYDKFSLNTVWQAQLAVNTAVHSFRKDDFENYLRFAKQAHTLYPGYRNSMKVHAVASSVEGRWGQALDDFEGWLEIEPWSRAAKWGIADIRLKLGQVDQARMLIDDLGISEGEVEAALSTGEGTLQTRSFFSTYREELDRIYTD